MGDVWLVDSCGTPEEKLDECGARPCRIDECELPPTAPCLEPPHGRCEGDTVHLCLAGKPVTVDCRDKGLRCAYGEEGAECQPDVPRALRCSGRPRCEGNVLLTCAAGRLVRTDCAARGDACLTVAAGTDPACVEVRSPDAFDPACGPCGCPTANLGPELSCDGHDEDGDGLIDEEHDCGPVPVVAFIVTDASGRRSHADEDVELELQHATAAFAKSEVAGAPTFVLDQVIYLPDPQLLELDEDEFMRLATEPRVHPPREAFYVPVVFTDRLISGETPKAGLSTLPNATCGGLQEGYGPDVGIIAVAKERYPTTVTHELGHFLGLCHTHDQHETAPIVAAADPQTGKLNRCGPSCRGEGDGICDTPPDPGPERCRYDPGCRTSCGIGSAEPDATNLMSYYTGCRDRFTEEQVRVVQHTLALRRGWHRCVGERCACHLGDPDCPAGMSCRPTRASGDEAMRCTLDGPHPAGADCDHHAECGHGSLCLIEQASRIQRCVRPCRTSSPDCDCQEAGPDLYICAEDLKPR
jgi:hypothetical protein